MGLIKVSLIFIILLFGCGNQDTYEKLATEEKARIFEEEKYRHVESLVCQRMAHEVEYFRNESGFFCSRKLSSLVDLAKREVSMAYKSGVRIMPNEFQSLDSVEITLAGLKCNDEKLIERWKKCPVGMEYINRER